MDANHINRAMYCVLPVAALMLLLAVMSIFNERPSWMIVPIILAAPAASWLVIQGKRDLYMHKSIAGVLVLVAGLALAALIAALT